MRKVIDEIWDTIVWLFTDVLFLIVMSPVILLEWIEERIEESVKDEVFTGGCFDGPNKGIRKTLLIFGGICMGLGIIIGLLI